MAVIDSVGASDDAWHRLLDDNNGVLHRLEIPADLAGWVRRELRAGRWRRLARNVVVSHNGPLSVEQRRLAVVKAAPPGSALSGPTAAELDGLRGFGRDNTYVTIPCGTSFAASESVIVHYSRFLGLDDVHPLREPRRTRPARSVIDAASWTTVESYARAVILAAVQQGIVVPPMLWDALSRRGPCLNHALIEETIGDAEGGVASVPEHEFDGVRRQWRIPEPTRQNVLMRPTGRFYLDADWEEYQVSAEIDGVPHMDILNWDADLDRMNEIAIDHRLLLRFTSYAVRHRPMQLGETISRALTSRGWQRR